MTELDSTALQLIAAANQHAYANRTDEIRVRTALQRRLAEDRHSRLGWQISRRLWLAAGITLVTAGAAAHVAVQRLLLEDPLQQRPTETSLAAPSASAAASRRGHHAWVRHPPAVEAAAPVAPTTDGLNAEQPAPGDGLGPEQGAVEVRRLEPSPANAAGSMRAEAALIGQAHRAVQQGNVREARQRLRAHAARFPQGALASEAVGLKVLIACKAKDPTAAERLRRFRQAWPRSPLLSRLEEACGARGADAEVADNPTLMRQYPTDAD